MLVDAKEGGFVEAIVEASCPKIEKVFGEHQIAAVVGGELKVIDSPLLSAPKPLATSTLQSIVDAFNADWTKNGGCGKLIPSLGAGRAQPPAPQQVVVVSSSSSVDLMHPSVGDHNQQFIYVRALAKPSPMPLGTWLNPSAFITVAQCAFLDSIGLKELLKTAGSISSSDVLNVSDDGLGQSVQTVSGVSTKGVEKPLSCFFLIPRRTFAEIKPPHSTFGLRLRLVKDGEAKRLELMLTEWTPQQWETDTIALIATWLRKKLGVDAVILS